MQGAEGGVLVGVSFSLLFLRSDESGRHVFLNRPAGQPLDTLNPHLGSAGRSAFGAESRKEGL